MDQGRGETSFNRQDNRLQFHLTGRSDWQVGFGLNRFEGRIQGQYDLHLMLLAKQRCFNFPGVSLRVSDITVTIYPNRFVARALMS